MRRLVVLGLVGALIVMAPSSPAVSLKVRGPFLLVSLPSLGTITWRCDPARRPGLAPGLPGLALGFRSFRVSATDHVRFHVGTRTILTRIVQPGRSLQLPYLRSRVQQLDIVQQTGAGTLRAFLTVTFASPGTSTYCYPYLPPRIDLRVLPRR